MDKIMKEALIKLKKRLHNLSALHDGEDDIIDMSGILDDLLQLLIEKETP
jgi:hypothetical protein